MCGILFSLDVGRVGKVCELYGNVVFNGFWFVLDDKFCGGCVIINVGCLLNFEFVWVLCLFVFVWGVVVFF